jgi:hypothetical protein
VVNPKEVDRRTLVHATEQLSKAGGRVLGTILNAVSSGGGYGYGYDYDYYYYAADKDKAKTKKAGKGRHDHANRPGAGVGGEGQEAEAKLAMTWGGDAAVGDVESQVRQPPAQPASRPRSMRNGGDAGAAGSHDLEIWDRSEGLPG